MSLLFSLTAFIILFFFGRYLGRIVSLSISIGFSIISLVINLYYFIDVFFFGHISVFFLGNWIHISDFIVPYKFLLDPLSISFATLISFITLLILIYSYDYLYNDPNLVKFFSYLNFFSFSMTCLCISGNYLVMFLGWETVGLASYLLINFWTTRNQANQAALKAIIFNRVGDIAFLAGLALLNLLFHSLEFEDIELLLPTFKSTNIVIFSYNFPAIEILAFFLLVAASAKSAQILLHPWLPDAMEGPTPVSALLHSATMVTAGVFVVLRSSLIFTHAPFISSTMAILGLITANFASFTGLLQYDIKRIIAFSTCSQLGMMIYAAGVGNYQFALFHLINHAFFKALLFMCAGSVIHAVNDQDIRRMGGLFKSLPITYITMLVASLSLVGFPFLSGFYSKDFLLEGTFAQFQQLGYVIYIISALSTFISSFYSFRLIYLVFFGEIAIPKKILRSVSESSPFLYGPMLTLGILSIFSGFFLKDLLISYTAFDFFLQAPFSTINHDLEFFNDFFKKLPTFFSLLGIISVYLFYVNKVSFGNFLYKKLLTFSFLFSKKFYIDAIYSWYLTIPTLNWALDNSYKLLDKGLYETAGPSGLYAFVQTQVSRTLTMETTTILYRLILLTVFFVIVSTILFTINSMLLAFIVFLSVYLAFAPLKNSSTI
jgi:proton-translocating NADH-quinone oxidoreductase chain L